MSALATTADVIRELGGYNAVRALVGARSHQRVYNWKLRGRFPPETYQPITAALSRAGHEADPALWRLAPPSPQEVADGKDAERAA